MSTGSRKAENETELLMVLGQNLSEPTEDCPFVRVESCVRRGDGAPVTTNPILDGRPFVG